NQRTKRQRGLFFTKRISPTSESCGFSPDTHQICLRFLIFLIRRRRFAD
ncbi:unnamed protein product, partial [Arabidopsis halleri]